MSCILTFSDLQRCLDTILDRIVVFSKHTAYKRQASRIAHKSQNLRSIFPYLDEHCQRHVVHSLDQINSHLGYWSGARLVDAVLHMSTNLSALEEAITTKCLQVGVPVPSNPKLEADIDWQDGLMFYQQMLRQDIFCKDAAGLRGTEALTMMHIMQSILDATRPTDHCRGVAFNILNKLCEATCTFKPLGIPILTIRSDLESMKSRGVGAVSRGYLSSGQLICAKTVSAYAARNSRSEVEKQFRREVLLWHQLSHPFILPLLGITDHRTSPDITRMISPWCQNGNIKQYLRHPGAANVNRIQLLHDVCVGLLYLHDHVPVVIHGDLKCANVLIQDDGSPCLSDFGLSTARNCGTTLASGLEGGSTRWMSIERVCSQDDETYIHASLRKESDMWSLGMLVLEAFTGQVPYRHLPTDMDVLTAIAHGDRPSRPMEKDVVRYGLNDELWELLWKCWQVDPGLRPTLPYFLSVMQRLAECWSNR